MEYVFESWKQLAELFTDRALDVNQRIFALERNHAPKKQIELLKRERSTWLDATDIVRNSVIKESK